VHADPLFNGRQIHHDPSIGSRHERLPEFGLAARSEREERLNLLAGAA
jgi:hypothetical protein